MGGIIPERAVPRQLNGRKPPLRLHFAPPRPPPRRDPCSPALPASTATIPNSPRPSPPSASARQTTPRCLPPTTQPPPGGRKASAGRPQKRTPNGGREGRRG